MPVTTATHPRLNSDVTVHYHVAPLDPPSNEVNSFWFEDSASLVCDLERKLGVTSGMGGLIMDINGMAVDEVHAHKDPSDENALVVAETPEILTSLLEGIELSIRRQASIESRTMSDAEIIAVADAFDVTGLSHDMMHRSTIDLANAAWKARAEIQR